jgi:BirA family transcriptional regulator, biotin operon repressor / biotin---[acetyl-CoA-carboxylase] ligase
MTANFILERVTETKSTNDDLLARWRAGELVDPVARITHHQTAGKGRAGRTWLAKPGDSLSFSLAFPFQRSPTELSGLSLLVGLAVIHGIAQACQLDQAALYSLGLRLKWPNDLLLNNAKIGGILIEGGHAKENDPTWMVIGIGINLHHAQSFENDLGNEIKQKVGSLDQLISPASSLPDTEFIWLKLLESLERSLRDFDQNGFTNYQKQWERWDAYRDQAIRISGTHPDPIDGIAKGVNNHGALLVQQDHQILSIHVGDVSLRRQS